MLIFQTLALTQQRFLTLRTLTSPSFWYWTIMLFAAGLFLNSLLSGGLIWDEPNEFEKVRQQLLFARDVLFGSTNWTFRSFPGDNAFYGIGTVLPAYVF